MTAHLIFDILSTVIAAQYYYFLKRKHGDILDEDQRIWILVAAAAGALIGSRLVASLENPELFLHPPIWWYYYANKTVVGGLVGGFIGVEIAKKILNIKVKTGDLLTYPLILGMIIGRVGCQLTGVSDGTVGNVTTLSWGFDQGDGLMRHPTSLYEIIFLIFIWVFLHFLRKRYQLENGIQFRIFLTLYLTFRFFVDFLKLSNPILFGLNSIQIVALLCVIFLYYSLIKNPSTSSLVRRLAS